MQLPGNPTHFYWIARKCVAYTVWLFCLSLLPSLSVCRVQMVVDCVEMAIPVCPMP